MKSFFWSMLVIAIVIQSPAWAGDKILVILSAANKLVLKDGREYSTGYYMAELTMPMQAILEAGYDFDIATPGGVLPSADPSTKKLPYHPFPLDVASWTWGLEFVENNEKLRQPLNLHQLTEVDLSRYVALFVPGGYAPMVDLVNDPAVASTLLHFHRERKLTGLLCHGSAVSLSLRNVSPWPYQGYRMTIMGDREERFLEKIILKGEAPYAFPENFLRQAGGIVENRTIFRIPNVIQDRELITGQNQYAAREFGRVFVEALRNYKAPGK